MATWMVEAAPDSAHGFDANTKITATAAKKLKAAGFAFAVRYLTRKSSPDAHDLDKKEAETLRAAGLAVMAVQHVPSAGWKPTEKLGKEYGKNAVAHAKVVGLPEGVTVWLDLEGVHGSVPPETIINYCNAWHRMVEQGGYFPGIYVGANSGLTGQQLYWQLRMKQYWRSGSKVPDIPVRGYCMLQTIIVGDKVGGVEIDRNAVTSDNFGATPFWATAPSAAIPRPLADLSDASTSHDDEVVLRALAESEGLEQPMERLIDYRNTYRPTSMPRYWAIVDFDLHSRKPRLFVFDVVADETQRYLCAHGIGSEGDEDDGYADTFSNKDGSKASSLGIYYCAEPYYGDHGKSLRLDGLETTNSAARHRAIVIHGADYVSKKMIKDTGRIGRSWGCPAVENKYAEKVVDQLKFGSLLIAWRSND